MRVMNVQGPVTKPHFVLAYGASGTGKTHLCGTLGELGRVLFIDIDQGHETLACASELVKARENITVVSFDTFKDLNTAYKAVAKNDPAYWTQLFNKGKQDVDGKPITPEHLDYFEVTEPFDWVVWDTWSEIQFYMMEELRQQKSHGAFGGTLDFRKNVEIQHWGMLTDLNKLSIQELRKCNVNQVFIMQETMTKDELSGMIVGGPAIHGKMVQEVPAFFGVVIHTSTDTMGRFTQTTKSKGKWPAKSRRGPGADFVGATMKEVLNIE